MENKVRKHLLFSGRVQGVGFRYRSYYIARNIGLSGWVQNTWDDRVEMEVQGTRDQIDELIHQLNRQIFIDIDRVEEEEIPLISELGFEIRG